MKAKLMLLVFALSLSFGCSSDISESEDSGALVSNTQEMGPERPFKVRGYGTFGAVTPDGSCDLPVQIALEGSGNATHLGRFTVELTWCFVPPTGPLYIYGTITAANGDLLFIETIDQGIGDNGEVYETFAFMGGTGRFEEASGQFDLYTATEFDTSCEICGTYSNYGEGTIRY